MVHPEIKNGWHSFQGGFQQDKLDGYDFFVGRFQRDNKYHLLGYRPREVAYMFSENECSSLDEGVVELPEGKTTLRELVRGEALRVIPEEPSKPYEIYFGRFR